MNIFQKEQKPPLPSSTNKILRSFNSTIKNVQKSLKPVLALSTIKTDRIKNIHRRIKDLEFSSDSNKFKHSNQYMNYLFPQHHTKSSITKEQQKQKIRNCISSSKSQNQAMFLKDKYQDGWKMREQRQQQVECQKYESKLEKNMLVQLGTQNTKLKLQNQQLKKLIDKYQRKIEKNNKQYYKDSNVNQQQFIPEEDKINYNKQIVNKLKRRIKAQIQYFTNKINARQKSKTNETSNDQTNQNDIDYLWGQFLNADRTDNNESYYENMKQNNLNNIMNSRPKYFNDSGVSTQRSRPFTSSPSAYPLTSRNR